MYKFVPYKDIEPLIDEMKKEGVSEIARSPHQFLDQYKQHGEHLPPYWIKKRDLFIKRTYAAYKLNPTRRRYLALIAWAYRPH